MSAQLHLPLYDARHVRWSLPDEDLFVALLLELGPSPSRDHLMQTFGVHPYPIYYTKARDALEKYYLPDPDAPVPFDAAHGFKLDSYMNWLDSRIR